MRRVLLRCDAGPGVGGGHLVRSLALLHPWQERGGEVLLASRGLPLAWRKIAEAAGCRLLPLAESSTQEDDADQCLAALASWPVDCVVVDHYGLDERWERKLRVDGRRLLAIDDMADRRHDCDVLLDQNDVRPERRRYRGLVPPGCELMLGPGYALLRPEFARLREQSRVRQEIGRLLVFFSSSDDGNETLKALRGVALLAPGWQLDVVTGGSHPDPAGIEQLCGRLGWRHHHQIDYMARLMLEADLALGGAGSASWERCALGLPALVSVLDDNQKEVERALTSAGAAISLGAAAGLTPDDYATALSRWEGRMLSDASRAAFALADGLGAERALRGLNTSRG